MKTSIVKGALHIDMHDLLNSIRDEDKSEMLKHVACDDQVIADVTAQILNGWTEDGWHGPKTFEAQADTVNRYAYALDKAAREIAKRSGEVAKREIERLEKALSNSEKRRQELEDEKHAGWRQRERIL